MLAVVQIGSKTWRSPCRTACSVRAFAGAGCAFRKPGADRPAAAKAAPLMNLRRDVAMVTPTLRAAGSAGPQDAPGAFTAARAVPAPKWQNCFTSGWQNHTHEDGRNPCATERAGARAP